MLLKEDLGVDFYVYKVVDGKFGAFTNGSWNGLIGEVVSGKADMAADFLTVSEIRLKFVDFPEQFLRSEMIMASKVKTSFLSSLNFEVFAGIRPVGWALIFGITFVTSLFIFWSERLIPYGSKSDSWVQAFTYAFGLLVQRDVGGSLPQFLGSRTVSIFLAVAMMIVMTAYVAVLAARNITSKKTVQVSGLNDPKVQFPTPNFKIGTFKDSFYSQMFEKSKNTKLRRLGQFMKNYNLKDAREIAEHLQKGTLDAAVINTLHWP